MTNDLYNERHYWFWTWHETWISWYMRWRPCTIVSSCDCLLPLRGGNHCTSWIFQDTPRICKKPPLPQCFEQSQITTFVFQLMVVYQYGSTSNVKWRHDQDKQQPMRTPATCVSEGHVAFSDFVAVQVVNGSSRVLQLDSNPQGEILIHWCTPKTVVVL